MKKRTYSYYDWKDTATLGGKGTSGKLYDVEGSHWDASERVVDSEGEGEFADTAREDELRGAARAYGPRTRKLVDFYLDKLSGMVRCEDRPSVETAVRLHNLLLDMRNEISRLEGASTGIPEVFLRTDWPLLRAQKQTLLETADISGLGARRIEAIDGIVNFLDAIMDHAADDLGLEVFDPDPDEEVEVAL